jgi:hypothetical protein
MADFEKELRLDTFGNTAIGIASPLFLLGPSNADKDHLIVIVGSRNQVTPSRASDSVAKAALAQYGNFFSLSADL